MEPTEITTPSFRSALSLVSLGNAAQLHDILAQEPAPYTALERVYLQAWIACECAQSLPDLNEDEKEAYWREATEILLESHDALLVVHGADAYFSRPTGSLRRHRPWTQWFLGKIATSLDAPSVEHYAQALRFLDERRMNIPWLRIQVLCDQGQALMRLQASRAALAQYEKALDLTQMESAHETLSAIFIGLCEAYGQLADDEHALFYGKQALTICPDDPTRRKVLSLLGQLFLHLGNSVDAFTAYRDALTLAQSATQRIDSLVALVLLCLKTQNMAGARRYCTQALTDDGETIPAKVRGSLYRACGKVAQFQPVSAGEPPQAQLFSEECVSWYLNALAVCPRDTDVLSEFAQLLSKMVEQDSQVTQAVFWQDAYRTLTQHITRP